MAVEVRGINSDRTPRGRCAGATISDCTPREQRLVALAASAAFAARGCG